MRRHGTRRGAWRRLVPGLVLALILVYFAAQAVRGERGLLAWARVSEETARLEARLAELRARREALERQVGQLRREAIDPDRLDEQLRAMLGHVRPDEVIVLEPEPPSGAARSRAEMPVTGR